VAVDSTGNVYVADSANSRIRKIDTSGNVTTFAGNGQYGPQDGTGGPNGTAELFGPAGVAVDGSGNVYVADTLNERICKIDPSGNVTTVAGEYQPGTPGTPSYADGPGGTARFSSPTGLAVTAIGIIYVADTGNNRIREIDTAGYVTTVAGNGQSAVEDGTLGASGTAGFSQLGELILDGNGTLYASDDDQIRKIVP
jgi:sugar lactone lactonase YvrE